MSGSAFRITPVRSAGDLAATAGLFEAYAASLPIDLAYQGFSAELAALPGKYAPPWGELLLARGTDESALGCVGLRPLAGGECEMKRLYVSPAARGLGLGRALAAAIVANARGLGYDRMRLDTLRTMHTALALYADLGFVETAAYYDTPIAGTIFLALSWNQGQLGT